MARKSTFGNIRKLPSGRYQARFTAPSGKSVAAPTTFDTKVDANAWLSTVRADLVRGAWLPHSPTDTFGDYAEQWLAHRPLKPRTRSHYRKLLDNHLLPTFGTITIRKLTPADVRSWHARQPANTPTLRAHSYALLKTICATAVAEDVITANPCRIRGAAQAKRAGSSEPATLEELAVIVDAMPGRYKLMVWLAAWCALRFGELVELRGKDIDVKKGVIKVRRGLTWVDGTAVIGTPKSDAGVRDVAIPPHLMPEVKAHLRKYAVGANDLLFPSASDTAVHMRPSTLYRVYYPAREAAGRPDLRWHDLRHTGAVLAAATGATLAELMGRLGHSTPAAALRYQHAAKGRDAEIAALLSALANGSTDRTGASRA